jgi:hypothetical protein
MIGKALTSLDAEFGGAMLVNQYSTKGGKDWHPGAY